MSNTELNCCKCGKEFGFTERIYTCGDLWQCEDCAIKKMQENDNKDKTIADLEAKLAESEKSNEYFEDRIEKADKEIKENYRNYNKLVEEYNQLKQQLFESGLKTLEEIKLSEQRKKMLEDLSTKNWELEQQLAEKDEEAQEIYEMYNQERKKNWLYNRKSQDKISFALEQLEKVKEKLLEEIENVTELLDPLEYDDYHEFIGCGRGYKNSIEEIDNLINELKEMK